MLVLAKEDLDLALFVQEDRVSCWVKRGGHAYSGHFRMNKKEKKPIEGV